MIPARQARCAGLSGCNPSHRCLPSPRVTLLAMPALCRLLSEGGISARIELPGREPWAGTCERRSVEQRRNGVSVGKLRLWGGSGFAVGWGWGEEEGMGKAREVFSRKESSWEKKIPHLGSYWLLGVLFRKQRIRKRTQHKASRVLQNIRPFSLTFFFFFLVEGGHLTTVLSTAPKKEKWAVLYKWSDCQTKIECVFFTPKALLHNLVLFPQAAEVILVLKSCPVWHCFPCLLAQ